MLTRITLNGERQESEDDVVGGGIGMALEGFEMLQRNRCPLEFLRTATDNIERKPLGRRYQFGQATAEFIERSDGCFGDGRRGCLGVGGRSAVAPGNATRRLEQFGFPLQHALGRREGGVDESVEEGARRVATRRKKKPEFPLGRESPRSVLGEDSQQ